MKNNTLPTKKQKDAFKKVIQEGKSPHRAMKEVGYDDTTAKNPKNLTESKGWKELMETYLPDSSLSKKHKELLNAVNLEKLSFGEHDTDEEIRAVVEKMEGYKLLYIKTQISSTDGSVISKYAYVKAPDNMTQDKALDKAYKLKGKYEATKTDITTGGKPLMDISEVLKKSYGKRDGGTT
jgi:hypothetical protein